MSPANQSTKPAAVQLSPAKKIGAALALLAASLFSGIVVISIGVGSEFTAINTVMSPLVCPGDVIIPVWTYKRPRQFASGPDLSTRWLCVNRKTGEAHVAGYRTIFTAGAVYGAILTILGAIALRRAFVTRTSSASHEV